MKKSFRSINILIVVILFIYNSKNNVKTKNNNNNNRILQESNHAENTTNNHSNISNETLIIYFIIISLLVGAWCREIKNNFKIPYSPLLLIVGFIFGVIAVYLFDFGSALLLTNNIDPHGILYIFIPALVYESAANSDSFTFKRELGQVLVLAGFGVLIGTALLAVVFKVIWVYDLTWLECFTLSSIISATDPVAVVALLNDIGTNIGFKILLEGESLWNDGTAMVIFTIFSKLTIGEDLSAGSIIVLFIRLTFGGILWGFIISYILIFILDKIVRDDIHSANLTVVFCYLTFFLAEYYLGVSGILSIVVLGMIMSSKGKLKINPESEHSLHYIWSYLQYVLETILFFFTGIFIGSNVLQKTNVIGAIDILKVIAFFIFMILARFTMLMILWPLINLIGNKINFKDIIILTYGGLRGAIGLSLGLIILTNTQYRTYFRELVIFYISLMILMTVLINGLTIKKLIKLIGFQKKSKLKIEIISNIKIKLLLEGFRKKQSIRYSRFYKLVNWENIYKNCGFYDIINFIDKSKKDKENSKKVDNKKSNIKNGVKNTESSNNFLNNNINTNNNVNKVEDLESQPRKLSMLKAYQDKLNENELLIEARIRFYNLIKTQIWETYEHNLCSLKNTQKLSDLTNYCLENPKRQIWLWEILNETNYSFNYLHKLLNLSKKRFIGIFFRKYLFDILLNKYETIYILIYIIKKVKIDEADIPIELDIIEKINCEINKLQNSCESYLFNLKDEFRSIIQIVQEKRASILVLNHMKFTIDNYKNIGLISGDEYIKNRKNVNKLINKLKYNTYDYNKIKDISSFSLISGAFGNIPSKDISLIEQNSIKNEFYKNDIIQSDNLEFKGIYIITKGIVEEFITLGKSQKIGIGYVISYPSYLNNRTIGLYKALNYVETYFIPKFILDSLFKKLSFFREKLYRTSALNIIQYKNNEIFNKFGNNLYIKLLKTCYFEYKIDKIFFNTNGFYIFKGIVKSVLDEIVYKEFSFIEKDDENYVVVEDSIILMFHKKSDNGDNNQLMLKKNVSIQKQTGVEGNRIKILETTFDEQYIKIKNIIKKGKIN